jgi:hypothetical protein
VRQEAMLPWWVCPILISGVVVFDLRPSGALLKKISTQLFTKQSPPRILAKANLHTLKKDKFCLSTIKEDSTLSLLDS